MRIITGKLKGRTIDVPKTGQLRPTSDRAKEGIFSVISARRYFDRCRILDLFAGSGNLGFEAISRGAAHCLFVDQEAAHTRQIVKTAEKLGVSSEIQTITRSTEQFLEKNTRAPFDFIFADPPYDYFLMDEMLDTILTQNWLAEDGWFILEHDKYHDFSEHEKCVYSKAYGRTTASIFMHNPDEF
jgi:16S rRNA (guanine966-N2)-methyltransferase